MISLCLLQWQCFQSVAPELISPQNPALDFRVQPTYICMICEDSTCVFLVCDPTHRGRTRGWIGKPYFPKFRFAYNRKLISVGRAQKWEGNRIVWQGAWNDIGQTSVWRWIMLVSNIELYIRTRVMLLAQTWRDRKETRASFCTRVEYEVHVGVCVYWTFSAMLLCQLTKWPHKKAAPSSSYFITLSLEYQSSFSHHPFFLKITEMIRSNFKKMCH